MGSKPVLDVSGNFHFLLKMATSIGIINQIKKKQVDKKGSDDDSEASSFKPKGAKTAYDVNRAKIEKLMKNPERPVNIPEPRKEKDPNKASEFVYNVMGSSAGAGSGEFHVYRQIRRKENARQKIMGDQKDKDDQNAEYHAKIEENERDADERTAKKRAKRQKQKEKMKQKQKEKNKKQKTEEKGPKKKKKKKKKKVLCVD